MICDNRGFLVYRYFFTRSVGAQSLGSTVGMTPLAGRESVIAA